MLGTLLAALQRWNEANLPLKPSEHALASVSGRHVPLSHEESVALQAFLTSQLAAAAPSATGDAHHLREGAFTPGPYRVVVVERGQRALLVGRDAAGEWEIANVNLCMGVQAEANLQMFRQSPDTLAALQDLLTARALNHPMPWERAEAAATAAIAPAPASAV